MTTGRPSKYSPDYCSEVVIFLSEGHSVTAFAGHIGVSRATVFNWANEHSEFLDALKAGQAAATKFWEAILIKVARDGGGNATAAIFGLKNRASEDWADKVLNEHTGKDGGPIETTDLTDADVARRVGFILNKGIQPPKPTEH
jgi:hypothetical protein